MRSSSRFFRFNSKCATTDLLKVWSEDFCVSVAMEAYKDIIKNEPDDPFRHLLSENTKDHNQTTPSNTLFYETDTYEDEGEEVAVTTREFDGKTYYTFIILKIFI